jgi:putative PIN family toxin of toxin-antitoxin system
MMSSMVRVVFDCNVLAQAILSQRGPAHACLELARCGQIQLVWSDYVIQEVCELPAKLPTRLRITQEQVLAFVNSVAEYAQHIAVIPALYELTADCDDSHYINLALSAGASLITSRDRHLLELMDPSSPQSKGFRQRFPELEILRPEQLLQRIPRS